MIDLHSHILYGLDDGAKTIEDTLAMARQAVADGISVIVATPHHHDGAYDNPPDVIEQRIQEVAEALGENQIPLSVLPGMEIHAYGEIVGDLKEGKLVTYNHQNHYILLELPHDHVPRYIEQLIFDLQVAGIVPVIAHPERNRQISEHPNLLYGLIKQGALSQLTAASVAGKFGKKLQKTCFELIDHNLCHVIATDAHNTGSRGFILSQAYEEMKQRLGQEYVLLFHEHARYLIQGREVLAEPPEKFKKKIFGIF
jgi:protein-tyrosine phosphatase